MAALALNVDTEQKSTDTAVEVVASTMVVAEDGDTDNDPNEEEFVAEMGANDTSTFYEEKNEEVDQLDLDWKLKRECCVNTHFIPLMQKLVKKYGDRIRDLDEQMYREELSHYCGNDWGEWYAVNNFGLNINYQQRMDQRIYNALLGACQEIHSCFNSTYACTTSP